MGRPVGLPHFPIVKKVVLPEIVPQIYKRMNGCKILIRGEV